MRSEIIVGGDDGLMKPLEPPKLQVLIRDPDSGRLRMPEALDYTYRNHETINDRCWVLLEDLEILAVHHRERCCSCCCCYGYPGTWRTFFDP